MKNHPAEIHVSKVHPICKGGRHYMYVRERKWQNDLQALRCIDCGTTVMIRVPEHIPLPQGPKFAQVIANKINEKEIDI